ncbi:MAG: oligosaccharide flippase family protein, partial [Planctomycetes bacterium]|nr:oligosaccharide flippase family protein [Planctomycetota bacterium]
PETSPTERPLSGLVKHSAIYSAAPVLRQLISIGMSPFYTAWLGTAGAGVKENADLWGIALQQVLGQNVLGSMVRFYYDQKGERERAAVVTSCTLLVLLAAFALSGLALACVPWLTPLLLGRGEVVSSAELERVCTLLLLLVPFQLATVSGNYYLFALKRSRAFTAIQMGKLLFEVTLNVYLMGVRGLGVTGFLLSMLAGEVLTSAGLVGWMLVRLRPRIDWALLRPILRYAAPLVPVGLLQLLLHQGDKRIVLELLGQEAAGVYGFGFKIAMLVTNMILGPFIVTWQPWIFGIEDPAERARLVARVGTYAVLTIAVASLGVILFGRQAAFLLAGRPEFHAAYQVVPFVATGYVFWALYNVSQTPLFLAKRTGPLLLVNLGAVVLNVRLNLWLVPEYGIAGAAATVLVTFAVLAGLGMNASRRSAGVRFEFGRLVAILACVSAGAAVALGVDTLEDSGRVADLAALAIKAAALCLLVLALWTRVLRPEERLRFRSWARARLARGG